MYFKDSELVWKYKYRLFNSWWGWVRRWRAVSEETEQKCWKIFRFFDNDGGVFHVDDDDDKAPWASTDVVLVGVAQSRVTQAKGVSLIIGVIVTMIVAIVIVVVMIVKYWLWYDEDWYDDDCYDDDDDWNDDDSHNDGEVLVALRHLFAPLLCTVCCIRCLRVVLVNKS